MTMNTKLFLHINAGGIHNILVKEINLGVTPSKEMTITDSLWGDSLGVYIDNIEIMTSRPDSYNIVVRSDTIDNDINVANRLLSVADDHQWIVLNAGNVFDYT